MLVNKFKADRDPNLQIIEYRIIFDDGNNNCKGMFQDNSGDKGKDNFLRWYLYKIYGGVDSGVCFWCRFHI